MLDSREPGPINLGNPVELSIRDLAELVLEIAHSPSEVELRPLPEDDPTQNYGPILQKLASNSAGTPQVPLRDGIARTIDWHLKELEGELAS